MPKTKTQMDGNNCGIKNTGSDLYDENDENNEKNFLTLLFEAMFISLPFILLMNWWWPEVIGFDTFQFWVWDKELVLQGVVASWPIFVWGGGLTFIAGMLIIHDTKEIENAEKEFVADCISSANAGIFEEIIFRWLLFMSAIVIVQFINCIFIGITIMINWMLMGFVTINFELPRLIFTYIFYPIGNFFCLYNLCWLWNLNERGWVLGAAVFSANAKFRDGHKYLGIFGFINSWYIGLYLFWIMFNYGLVAAIVVHVIYDIVIVAIRFFHRIFRRIKEAYHVS